MGVIRKSIFAFLIGLFIFSVTPKIAYADSALGGGGCSETAINTAIGCLDVLGNQNQFLGDLLRWAVGVGSGIAFILIVYSGFMIMTGAGNPERIKAGQELLTSAISGLIMLIFCIFILRFIGVDILGLDRFGFGT